MPIEQVPFTGMVNLDDTPENVGNGMLRRSTRNLSWFGPAGNKRPQNLTGTINLFTAYGFSLPAGDNLCIGRHYDAVKYRMFWMNKNSNGNDGIYILNTKLGTIDTLIQNGINTDGDVLGFLFTVTINSIDIIYGDPVDGDILVYTDSLKRITRIPINLYLANTYNPIRRNYIDLAKQPPPIPIKCVYENATGLATNNLRNALFQFRTRQVFDVLDKCVYSTISECPLPYNPGDMVINQNPNKNGRIALYIPTGDVDVKKLEIWMQQTKDGITSDWLLVDTLVKSELSIPDNSFWRYVFYNDSTYPSADPTLTVIDQTYIPQQNNCSTVLNGNVVAVADTVEGYDQVAMPLMTTTVTPVDNQYATVNGLLFFAYQNPYTGYVTIYLTGTGTNDGNDNPSLLDVLAGSVLTVKAQNAAQAEVGFSITASDASVVTALTQLQVASIAQGWTFISLGTNSLVLYRANTTLDAAPYVPADYSILNTSFFAYLPNCNYGIAINYRDDKGRTNTVVTTAQCFIKTPSQFFGAYAAGVAQLALLISHRPPIWATGYQVLRTPQLSYNKILNWVSRQAYSQVYLEKQYAYIDVSNIVEYNKTIQASEGVVQYNFSPGDRVRFNARWDASGVGHDISTLNLDYEVLSLEVNPVINTQQMTGNFVKINYPTADITPGVFVFDGTIDYQHYQVLLYNLKAHQSNIVEGETNNNTYFEFGKWFGIGNSGTAQAYHMGNTQTQTANLSQAAIVTISDGDNFFRWRTVPVGFIYYYDIGNYKIAETYATPSATPQGGNVSNTRYEVGTQNYNTDPGLTGLVDYSSTDYIFKNKTASDISLRFTVDTAGATTDKAVNLSIFVVVINPSNNYTSYYLAKNRFLASSGDQADFTELIVDAVVPAGCIVFYIEVDAGIDGTTTVQYGQHVLKMEIIENIQIPVIEPSFSDVYAIVTSSNGKPAVVAPDVKQQEYPTRFRFSHPDQQGTNVNGISIFYPFDYDEFDRSKGKVMRMVARQRNARIFHERGTGVIGVYAKFIVNNDGTKNLIVSDTIITQNNIQYYDGSFGIGNQADGLFSDGYVDYHPDPVKGYLLRLSQDGYTPISEEGKVQTFVGPLATQYLNNHQGYYGGYAKILGCCYFQRDKKKECIFVFQSGDDIQGDTIVWDEAENAFTNWRDWQPDMIECGENVLYAWQKGVLYSFTNQNQYNTFFSNYGQIYVPGEIAQYGVIEQYGQITPYGVLYPASLDIVFNPQANAKKEYRAINYNSQYGKIWTAPMPTQIQTELGNQSTLLDEDLDFREGIYSAAFWRDVNSEGGLINGDFLKGTWMELILQRADPELIYIFGLYLNYAFSPRNG